MLTQIVSRQKRETITKRLPFSFSVIYSYCCFGVLIMWNTRVPPPMISAYVINFWS